MNKKLEVLREKTGEDFVQIDTHNFKSSKADVIIFENYDEVADFIKESVLEEIPYICNDLLREYLPERFHNDLILSELKEMCKFDHTILSNFISDKLMFTYDVMKINILTDLVMIDSEIYRAGDYWIFYLEHEIN